MRWFTERLDPASPEARIPPSNSWVEQVERQARQTAATLPDGHVATFSTTSERRLDDLVDSVLTVLAERGERWEVTVEPPSLVHVRRRVPGAGAT